MHTLNTCEELCGLLFKLNRKERTELLSDPSNHSKLLELIKTVDDILTLEKGPLAFEKTPLLIATLFPIYNSVLLNNLSQIAAAIQHNFLNARLLDWLNYAERNSVLERFEFSQTDVIKKMQLSTFLPYLNQSGQQRVLSTLENEFKRLIQQFEDVLIFQDIAFDAWPESLRRICGPILINHPAETADKINAQNVKTPLLSALIYCVDTIEAFSLILSHLHPAACTTAMLETDNGGDLLSITEDVFILTKTLIQQGRNDLFSHPDLKEACLDILARAELDEERPDIEHNFNYLYYSSFWLDNAEYNKIIVTPLVETGILAKIASALQKKQLYKLLQHPQLRKACMSIFMGNPQQQELMSSYFDCMHLYDKDEKAATISAICSTPHSSFFSNISSTNSKEEKEENLNWSSSEGEDNEGRRKRKRANDNRSPEESTKRPCVRPGSPG